MQLVDSTLYSSDLAAFSTTRPRLASSKHRRASRSLVARLRTTSPAERLLALLLAALFVAASPALLAAVRSVVSLAFQILLEAGHAALIAFQIFGR